MVNEHIFTVTTKATITYLHSQHATNGELLT